MRLKDPTHLYEGEPSPRAERAARLVSVVTHAPVISAFLFILLNVTADDSAVAVLSTVVTLLTATVIPIAVVQYYSVKFGNTDGDVYRREDRAKPLMFGIMSYVVGIVLLYFVGAPHITVVMMVSYAVCTVAVLLISTRWKISIHATGVMGPSMALSITYWPWGLLMFLLLPLVMWSRYVRRKHTPAQLVGGAVFGFLITAAVFVVLL